MPKSLPPLAIHPLMFAAYAVLFLYAQNIGLVRRWEVLSPLAWSVLGAALLLFVLSLLLRDVHRAGLITTGAVVWFFGYGHLAGHVAPEPGSWWLMIAWTAVVAVVTGLLAVRGSVAARATTALNVAGAVLIIFSLSTIVPHLLNARADAGGVLEPTGLQAQRRTTRDVYYLVFDRYGSESALRAEFGITDNDLYDWLEERGFDVARESYANYSNTSLSLASVLDLGYLDEVVAQQDPRSGDYGPVHEMIQNNLVGRFLREQRYRYIHVGSWFDPTRTVRVANESLASDSTTEFQAVLDETTALPLLTSLLPRQEEYDFSSRDDEMHVEAARFQFRALHQVIDEPGPKFVLAHVLLPHDPYTFDAEGRYVPLFIRHDDPVAPQFRAQLEYTNREIKKIIERLLARPEAERPIIILQADEGPYPARFKADVFNFDWSQATPAELEMKFGILNAYYLPAEPGQPGDLPRVAPDMTSVNTFRLVLERYFGIPLPFLPDRVYVSVSTQTPYNLRDVTDLLPGPGVAPANP